MDKGETEGAPAPHRAKYQSRNDKVTVKINCQSCLISHSVVLLSCNTCKCKAQCHYLRIKHKTKKRG